MCILIKTRTSTITISQFHSNTMTYSVLIVGSNSIANELVRFYADGVEACMNNNGSDMFAEFGTVGLTVGVSTSVTESSVEIDTKGESNSVSTTTITTRKVNLDMVAYDKNGKYSQEHRLINADYAIVMVDNNCVHDIRDADRLIDEISQHLGKRKIMVCCDTSLTEESAVVAAICNRHRVKLVFISVDTQRIEEAFRTLFGKMIFENLKGTVTVNSSGRRTYLTSH